MPDITMCVSKVCPQNKDCYRHEARPSKYQSYSNFEEECEKNDFNHFLQVAISNIKNNID